jgi:hypothetical protein
VSILSSGSKHRPGAVDQSGYHWWGQLRSGSKDQCSIQANIELAGLCCWSTMGLRRSQYCIACNDRFVLIVYFPTYIIYSIIIDYIAFMIWKVNDLFLLNMQKVQGKLTK